VGELILSWLSLFAAMMFVNMLAGSIAATLLFGAVLVCLQNL
jgi:hypothetical protein